MSTFLDDSLYHALERILKDQTNVTGVLKDYIDFVIVLQRKMDQLRDDLGPNAPSVLRDYFQSLQSELNREPDLHEVFEHPETDPFFSQEEPRIIRYSPILILLQLLRSKNISLHDLEWRQFEEVVAELLIQEGYEVQLGSGTKDGGKDIIAVKNVPGIGLVMSVWQAKKLKPGNKVGLSVIRELADTRAEHKASKGVIVTTTSLTQGALARVERDQYLLHKMDGADLETWIQNGINYK